MPKDQPHQEIELNATLSELVQEFLTAVAKLEQRVVALEGAVRELDQQHSVLLKLVGEMAKNHLPPAPRKKVLN